MAFSGRRRFSQEWASNPSQGGLGLSPAVTQRNQVRAELDRMDRKPHDTSPTPKAAVHHAVRPQSASPRMLFTPTSQPPRTPASASASASASSTPPLAGEDEYVARLVAEYTGSHRKPVKNVRVQPSKNMRQMVAGDGGGGAVGTGVNTGRTVDEQLQMQYDALVTKRRQVQETRLELRQQRLELDAGRGALAAARAELQRQNLTSELQHAAAACDDEAAAVAAEGVRLEAEAPLWVAEIDRLGAERRQAAAMRDAIAAERARLARDRRRVENDVRVLAEELQTAGAPESAVAPMLSALVAV